MNKGKLGSEQREIYDLFPAVPRIMARLVCRAAARDSRPPWLRLRLCCETNNQQYSTRFSGVHAVPAMACGEVGAADPAYTTHGAGSMPSKPAM